jgi:hypothetical protein
MNKGLIKHLTIEKKKINKKLEKININDNELKSLLNQLNTIQDIEKQFIYNS